MNSAFSGFRNRVAGLFLDREFFMRSNGQVKFLKISAKLQRTAAMIVIAILSIWVVATLIMAANQYRVSIERMALVKKEEKIQSAEERLAADKDSINEVVADLAKRQDLIEANASRYFNADELRDTNQESPVTDSEAVKKIGSASPQVKSLAQIEQRQIDFAQKITKIAQNRAKIAEERIRQFGLNPKNFINLAQGGPFIPFFSDGQKEDPRFSKMAAALEYMTALENGLATIPSTMPAASYTLSSAFGYRRDPINGSGAMHSGLDFKAAHGTPILAAADGVISKAGWMGGYGKTIEITHGNGLMTRYAHMSRLDANVGQKVERGFQIGRMGSTGRSTGTHLHFEVRNNGRAINPRKFLKANNNVLQAETNVTPDNSAEKQ